MFSNTYHLMLQPGADLVEAAGGLHKFIGRDAPIITDSGGFQVFSLDKPDAEDGKEMKSRRPSKQKGEAGLLLRKNENGVLFKSYRDGREVALTPESSVAAQKQLGADIIIPLDELPPYCIDPVELKKSVFTSHRWEARSLKAHLYVLCFPNPNSVSSPSVTTRPSLKGSILHTSQVHCSARLL
jgi:queuine tRNA-ribosyltransferase